MVYKGDSLLVNNSLFNTLQYLASIYMKLLYIFIFLFYTLNLHKINIAKLKDSLSKILANTTLFLVFFTKILAELSLSTTTFTIIRGKLTVERDIIT